MSSADIIGKRGEDKFGALCSDCGVTYEKSLISDDDGWDFILKLPLETENSNKPLDRKEEFKQVLVQVKATETSSTQFPIKLSNAKRFVDSDLPCFIVFIDLEDHASTFYLRHFWEEDLERSLKRLRKASIEKNPKLHKETMKFSRMDWDVVADNLVNAIQVELKSVGVNYAKEKAKLRDTLGYSEETKMTINFEGDNVSKLEPFLLGEIKEIPFDSLEEKDIRFDIEANEPKFKIENGSFSFDLLYLRTLSCALFRMLASILIFQRSFLIIRFWFAKEKRLKFGMRINF